MDGFVVEMTRDVRELVALEIALARAELETAARRARMGLVLFGAACVTAMLGLAMLPVGLALAVGRELPLWAAFLAVGGGLLVVAAAVGAVGVARLRNVDLMPRRAISALQPRRVADGPA